MAGVNVGQVEVLAETDKALLVLLEADVEKHWIPKSVIDPAFMLSNYEVGDLVVMEWFAKKEGLV